MKTYFYNYKKRTKEELIRIANVSWNTIKGRVRAGWSLRKAVDTPARIYAKDDLERFEMTTCPSCKGWGFWYEARHYGITVIGDCIFCRRYF